MSLASITVEIVIFALQVLIKFLDEVSGFLVWIYRVVVVGTSERTFRQGPTDTKNTVVIVGGNFAGLSALWELVKHSNKFRIILIEQKDYFEYTPGVLRLFCAPDCFECVARTLPKKDSSYQIIQGRVTSIVDNREQKVISYVHQSQSKSLSYDYLILATGSTYNYPITASGNELSWKDRKRGWEGAHQRLASASKILILGGGAVGVELAAEIVDYFPQKEVTLVDASPTLVPLFPKSVGEYASKWLSKHGVRLVLGKFLDSWDEKSCKLKDGTVLQADIVYVCFGDRPNSQCVSSALDATQGSAALAPFHAQLDRRKCLIVDNTLQLTRDGKNSQIFACGDVATPPTEGNKQAFHAETQGHLAARNVVRMDQRQDLHRYPEDIAGSSQMPLIFILSLGRYDGVLGFNQLIIPGPVTAVLKWGLEFTKVLHMEGRPIGKIIWNLAEELVLFMSRTFIKPSVSSTVTKSKTS